uniref:dolichyl-phosphate-mannose--protein mannosyltransferase n=1 Tax=Lepeophtheirus salmonis TaxID=72036 RepID=A0A0K2UVT7_LEPSM
MKWPYFLLWALTALCYWNGLFCDLVFDDVSAVRDNKDLRPSTPITNIFFNDFWGTPMSKEHSHKSYRPITVLTFRLNYLIHGVAPLGYHFVNVLLHGIVCCLYYKLCHVFVNRKTSFISSILFSVHPVHTEAVTGVVGRAELLSSIFFILSLLLFTNSSNSRQSKTSVLFSSTLFLVFVSLAVFSKEQGITVLGVAFLLEVYDFITSKKKKAYFWSRICLLISAGAVLLFLRFKVMGSSLPVFTTFDNPASYEGSTIRRLTWSYLLALNSWILLCPDWLCCDWTMGSVPLVPGFSDIRNLSTCLFFIVGGAMALLILRGLLKSSREQRSLFAALCLIGLPFLPASNLFFPVGFVVAERVLYIPSMGFCLLIGLGYQSLLSDKNKIILKVLLISTVIVHIIKCNIRNKDWRNEYDIFKSGLKVMPTNAKLWNNVGHALEAQEDYHEALKYFKIASEVQTDDIGAYINVGRTFNNLKNYKLAEEYYLKAKALLPQAKKGQRYMARIAPQHLSVFLNLGNLISKDPNRLEEADRLYRQAISMRSDYVQAYINRGDILIKMNRTFEAQEVYEKALLYENSNPDLFYNLGVVFIERGLHQKALMYFDKALSVDPNHIQSLMNSAVLMQELGIPSHRPIAIKRLHRVLEFTPNSERVYFNLAMLAMDEENHQDAEKWFKKAINLKIDFRSALFNLALLLNEQKRSIEAVPFLKFLLQYHPNHIKGLILLGDIYTNQLRILDEAEDCYKRILQIDPDHIQGRHNLCVVLVEKGRLDEAEKCLQEALSRAPNEQYIARHLHIVQKRRKLISQGTTKAQPNEG